MAHQKRGNKNSHPSNNGFNKHDMKIAWLASANEFHKTGTSINKNGGIFKPVGYALQAVGDIERVPVAGVDALSAKNPSQRWKNDLNTHFVRGPAGDLRIKDRA